MAAKASLQNQPSRLMVPLAIPVAELQRLVERKFPATLYRDASFTNNGTDNLKLLVKKSGKVRMQFSRSEMYMVLPLKVQAEKRLLKLPGGKSDVSKPLDFSLELHLASPLKVDQDWRLLPDIKLVRIKWLQKPNINLGFVKITLAKFVEEKLAEKMPELLRKANKAVHEDVNIKKPVAKVWDDLQKPVNLVKEPSVWLFIEPYAVTASEFRGEGRQLLVDLQVDAYMESSLIKDRQQQKPVPLPALRKAAGAVGPGFELCVMLHVPYRQVSRVLMQRAANKKFDLQGHAITLKRLEISGYEEHLQIRAELQGDINGSVYFRGIPVYDSLQQALTVTDFDYELESEEWLVSTADWLLHDTFREEIKDLLKFPMQRQLEMLPEIVSSGVKSGKAGKKVAVEIRQMQVNPGRAHITVKDLQLLVYVKGQAVISLKNL